MATIDEIADAAGISRRTFFLYFASKEDVVFGFLEQWAVRLAADIVARPAEENPVAAVQNSFRQLTAAYNDRSLALVRVVRATPSLREAERINREHLRMAVVNALATRLGFDPENDMRPQSLPPSPSLRSTRPCSPGLGGAQTMSSSICSTRRRRPSSESETRCARV